MLGLNEIDNLLFDLTLKSQKYKIEKGEDVKFFGMKEIIDKLEKIRDNVYILQSKAVILRNEYINSEIRNSELLLTINKLVQEKEFNN